MAWASTDLIPTSINASVLDSVLQGFLNDVTVKVSPKNSAGGIFDFTAATAARLNFQSANAQVTAGLVIGDLAPAIVANDATGLTITISKANLATIIANANSNRFNISLSATDGTTQLMVASGALSVSSVP